MSVFFSFLVFLAFRLHVCARGFNLVSVYIIWCTEDQSNPSWMGRLIWNGLVLVSGMGKEIDHDQLNHP